MKYLIDIGHPAHVHYFKNFAQNAILKGNKVLFTCRDKDVTINLLKYYNFNYINFGRTFKSKFGKVFGLFYYTIRLLIISITFKPNIFLNASVYSAFVSWLMQKSHISLEDTFNQEQVRIYKPFTNSIITGNYPHPDLGKKQIKVNGYQELLYLHPKKFAPNKSVLSKLGVNENEKYIILRFVSWNASHDYGHKGISNENKLKAINEFKKYGKVFISSEEELSHEFENYRIRISPHEMHDAMAFASLIFGESATMVSEGVCLGVPGIYLDNTGRYYTKEQEDKYGMCFNYSESLEDQEKAIQKGIELLKIDNLKEIWQNKREVLFEDSIDVSAFLVWFIENYPESARIMKENLDYQYNFK